MPHIRHCETEDDFDRVFSLIGEMRQWDVAQSAARGVDEHELVSSVYDYTPQSLRQKYLRPGSAIFLALDDGDPAGCAGFSRAASASWRRCMSARAVAARGWRAR